MTQADAAKFGKAVGDLTRQRILNYCNCQRRSVGEVANHCAVSQPTATHHLGILEDSELVSREKEGKTVFYTVRQETFVKCCCQMLNIMAPDDVVTKAANHCRCE